MMQCQLHQSVWMDQSFSGGSCPECTKERRRYVEQINKLTAENRELREKVSLSVDDAYEAMSALCEIDRPMANEARERISDEIKRAEGVKGV